MRSFLSVAAALGALQLVAAQDAYPACVVDCAVDLRGQFATFGCTSAEDRTCLCQNQDFGFGIRDCAKGKCEATLENVNNYFAQQFCPGVNAAIPSSDGAASETTAPPAAETSAAPAAETSAPPAEQTSAPPAETTSEPAPTSAPETSEAPATTSAESTAETATTTEAPTAETSAPATESTTETTETTEASETSTSESAAPTSSSDSDKDKNEKDNDSEEVGGGGLSAGAKAGIAVGVIAVVIAILGLVLCLLGRRKRQSKPAGRAPLEISKPMNNSAPAYRGSDDDTYEKYGDIEMTTRYEDMVPRTQPRTMV